MGRVNREAILGRDDENSRATGLTTTVPIVIKFPGTGPVSPSPDA